MSHFDRFGHDPDEHEVDAAMAEAAERPVLTLPALLDIAQRVLSVIVESDGADEHRDLIWELRGVIGTLEDASMTAGEITLPGAA